MKQAKCIPLNTRAEISQNPEELSRKPVCHDTGDTKYPWINIKNK